jgi:hypothetical protein
MDLQPSQLLAQLPHFLRPQGALFHLWLFYESLELIRFNSRAGEIMRVLISGASGLIGTELYSQLKAAGHEPLKLVRRKAKASDEISWNPALLEIDPEVMETIDAVVNLAGATTGRIPWTKGYKREIVDSRIK